MIQRIFLVGMMGAGKSRVGRELARALAWDLVDTDDVAERIAGMSVPEIFTRKGEAFFRELEKEALARVSSRPNAVIATGGGVVLAHENWKHMEAEGSLAVYLEASVSTLVERTARDTKRPLLTGEPGRIKEILRARRPFYERAPARVRVDNKTPARVAGEVLWLLEPDFSEEAPGFFVGRGAATRLPDIIRDKGYSDRVFLITERPLWNMFGKAVASSLRKVGKVGVHLIPGGEGSKSLEEAAKAWKGLASVGADRSTPVVALGGGVVGDLAGFVASTYMRGLPLFMVPTTLMSMVDSSLGGKNALNMGRVKNLVGSFHFPEAVIADPVFLMGGGDHVLLPGIAEAVKMGLVASPELWELLTSRSRDILAGSMTELSRLVGLAGVAKLRVVSEDPKDRGMRHILNFGHTVGHALELVVGLPHGHAVAIGMVSEASFGVKIGKTPPDLPGKIASVLRSYSLPTEMPEGLDMGKIKKILLHDKKRWAGKLRLPVLRDVGRAELVETGEDIV